MHQRVAHPFEGKGRPPSSAIASFSGQSLPGKQTPTLRISQNQRLPSGCEHTNRNQMQTDASNHPPNTLSVTCRHRRMPSLQGCGPVNLSREAVSRPSRPREAVLRPRSTSGGNFAAQSSSGGGFATPVDLGRQFHSPVDVGKQFCDPSRPREAVFCEPSGISLWQACSQKKVEK